MSDLIQFTPAELAALKALVTPAVAAPKWGPEIIVSGERPAWLRDEIGEAKLTDMPTNDWFPRHGCGFRLNDRSSWFNITAIRLSVGHPYYVATEKGFTYWPGGDHAPGDWDGGEVLRRGDPAVALRQFRSPWVAPYEHNHRWHWPGAAPFADIIGYRKREEPCPLALKLTKFAEAAEWAGLADVSLCLSHKEVAALVKVLASRG